MCVDVCEKWPVLPPPTPTPPSPRPLSHDASSWLVSFDTSLRLWWDRFPLLFVFFRFVVNRKSAVAGGVCEEVVVVVVGWRGGRGGCAGVKRLAQVVGGQRRCYPSDPYQRAARRTVRVRVEGVQEVRAGPVTICERLSPPKTTLPNLRGYIHEETR